MAMVKIRRKEEEEKPLTIQESLAATAPDRNKKPRRERGEGGSGCRTVILLFILILVAIFAACHQFRAFYTGTTPGFVRMPHTSSGVLSKALRQVEALKTAVKINGIITVPFTEKELNALLQKTIEDSGWKGQAAIVLDEHLTLDYTLPLTGIPGFNNRWASGRAEFAFVQKPEGLDIAFVSGTLNGRNIPKFIRNRFKGKGFRKRLMSAPGLAEIAGHIETINILDGRLVVTTRKASAAPPSEE